MSNPASITIIHGIGGYSGPDCLEIKAQGPGRGRSRAAGVQSGDSPYHSSMASLELGLEEKDPLWPRMSSLIPLPKEGLAGPLRGGKRILDLCGFAG